MNFEKNMLILTFRGRDSQLCPFYARRYASLRGKQRDRQTRRTRFFFCPFGRNEFYQEGTVKPVRAYLVLEDGSIYEGEARGAFREMACEVVFNTSMTGYLEILTDPSMPGRAW